MRVSGKNKAAILLIGTFDAEFKLLKKLLVDNNYSVLEASDSDSAAQSALDKNPHLIFINIMLPDKKGLKICRLIKNNKKLKNIPVFIFSPEYNKNDHIKTLELGAFDYIALPFDEKILITKIEIFTEISKSEQKHKQLEDELIQSENKERALRMILPNIFYRISAGGVINGKIIEINPAVDILGYTRAELIGKPLKTIIHPREVEKVAQIFIPPPYKGKERRKYYKPSAFLFDEMKIRERRTKSIETRLIAKNSKILDVIINATNLYDVDENNNAKFIGTCGIITDITGLKNAEKKLKEKHEQLIETQKIAAEQEKYVLVGQIAGQMAHDFNNILAIIEGNAELQLLNYDLDAELKKALELIVNVSERGKNLILNLVAFAKDQEPDLTYFNLNEKINLVLHLLKKDLESIKILTDYAPNLPHLLADPGMIEHMLVNLIQNSIHALSLTAQPELQLKTYAKNNKIYFEIRDNGCGIPPDYMDKIFDPIVTLKGNKDVLNLYKKDIKGSGYGLTNVKKYIDTHKGSISVKSELYKGCTFIISFPVIKKELDKEDMKSIEKEQNIIINNKKVLIIEDEIAVAHLEYNVLTTHLHHNVEIVTNGKIAVDHCSKNMYDVIILDYMLPDMNGLEVYYTIRKKNKKVPIIFISANIQFLTSTYLLIKNDPFLDYLSKPFSIVEFISKINKWLIKISK